MFALIWGVGLTLGALLYPNDPKRPVVVVALAIASFTYGGLLGSFFLAIFSRRAIQRDMILGMSVGLTCMAFIVFAGQISRLAPGLAPTLLPLSKIAWPWYVLIGTTITLAVGVLASLTHAAPRLDATGMRADARVQA